MEDPPTNNHTSNNNNITNINITNNSNNSNTSSSSSSNSSSSISSSGRERNSNNSSEPVRSRWTPKPEQILILESIFNSGMVNPPKEETVRIRKLLEKFGAVGDANVFYWFQNRRSRSRRRQRQLQASLAASAANPAPPPVLLGGGDGGFYHEYGNLQLMSSNSNNNTCTSGGNNSLVTSFAPSLFSSAGVEDVFSTFSGQMMSVISPHHHHPLQNTTVTTTCSSPTPILCPSDPSNLEFQSGIITVFINGVATQMAEGPVDVKAMFGEEVILVHSSGLPVPFNEYGISFQTLQHGESYFLVPRLA